jgi:hypothetical protein
MGQLSLPSGAIVYIDTAIVVYTIEANPTYFSALQPLWLDYQMGRTYHQRINSHGNASYTC